MACGWLLNKLANMLHYCFTAPIYLDAEKLPMKNVLYGTSFQLCKREQYIYIILIISLKGLWRKSETFCQSVWLNNVI